jgi:hypothetical protein
MTPFPPEERSTSLPEPYPRRLRRSSHEQERRMRAWREKWSPAKQRAIGHSHVEKPILAAGERRITSSIEAGYGLPLDSLLSAHGETSLCRMADTVILANCVERSELFSTPRCQQAPHTSGRMLQAALQEHFQLSVSISQINRVRAELGLSVSSQQKPQAKKTP